MKAISIIRSTAVVGVVTAAILTSMLASAEQAAPPPENDLQNLPPKGSTPLFWEGDTQIIGFRNSEYLIPTRKIEAGTEVLPLPRAEIDLGDVDFSFEGTTITLDQYLQQERVGGLLMLKDGKVVLEYYGLGNSAQTRWISFSVAKSVVAMLIGAAIKDGYIKSVDEKVTDYLPRLKSSVYAQSSIKNLLQMASGVAWNEDYADPDSDVASAPYKTLALYDYLADKPRDAAPGDKFNYNSAETNLAGTLLRSAVGNNLSTYLSEKIWRPFGMESDASWNLTEPGGGEFGGCCINATLRDYGRLGLFALNDGKLADGTPVLAEGWMAESTAPSKGYEGYGYFWWLTDSPVYQALGIFGQGIHIDPEHNVVIAIHSAREEADNDRDWAIQNALFTALTEAVTE
ncbi:beta-lactamase [Luminiphilus syltensis NOR5-1B]|uniref:Beta-lactamase n=1 Tax=Luminiphilus syltensis NOR5-1B TaxID=565045 RepID=B8KVG6_9GAMM|nr:serine hydrolase [Luminiphilus syltensis]EED36895.1 beta-lactamase [Luminiphilus syltensis NOR5-1B]